MKRESPSPNKRLLKVQTERVSTELTPAKWDRFIELIIDGTSQANALEAIGFTKKAFDVMLVVDAEKREQLDIARAEHHKRLWPEDLVLDICSALVEGHGKPLRAILEDMAPPYIEHPVRSFYSMLNADVVARGHYTDARRQQMEEMGDEILRIADDDSLDVIKEYVETKDGVRPVVKSNPTAVRRAEVMINTRKFLMSKIHHEMFGNKQQTDLTVTVKDHAAELAEARTRRREAADKAANLRSVDGTAERVREKEDGVQAA